MAYSCYRARIHAAYLSGYTAALTDIGKSAHQLMAAVNGS